MGDDEPREKSLTSSGSEVDAAGKSDESNTINGYGNEIPENWLGRFNYGIDLSNLLSLTKTGNSNGKSRLESLLLLVFPLFLCLLNYIFVKRFADLQLTLGSSRLSCSF